MIKAALRAQKALADTPSMLPVLKEAGVVDAGGQGLSASLKGSGQGSLLPRKSWKKSWHSSASSCQPVEVAKIQEEVLVNKYCTEFIILGEGIDPEEVRKELETQGDSVIVVGDEHVTKVHIHTDYPGKILQYCGDLGNLTEIAIDNMMLQNQEFAGNGENHRLDYSTNVDNVVDFPQVAAQSNAAKEVGVVAVVAGDGLADIFRSLGVDYIVTGGQTMNPSTEDLVKAVNAVNAKSVIILPNNKNVIFSAQQVKELVDKEVGVVPTRSAPQGISALMYFVQDDPWRIIWLPWKAASASENR